MGRTFTLLESVATAGVFSALSFWYKYGFMFGRESARKDLHEVIDQLSRGNQSTTPPPPPSNS